AAAEPTEAQPVPALAEPRGRGATSGRPLRPGVDVRPAAALHRRLLRERPLSPERGRLPRLGALRHRRRRLGADVKAPQPQGYGSRFIAFALAPLLFPQS